MEAWQFLLLLGSIGWAGWKIQNEIRGVSKQIQQLKNEVQDLRGKTDIIASEAENIWAVVCKFKRDNSWM